MENLIPRVILEEALDIRQLMGTGSVLHINDTEDINLSFPHDKKSRQTADFIGEPIESFETLEKTLRNVDKNGYIKKRIIEEGGGETPDESNTVSIVYTGYWEKDLEPFDFLKLNKPLHINLKESNLIPGIDIAVRSMLVGETSIFLFSHHVMFGELGIPPRIKPKAKCVFYIKLLKSIITPEEGEIDLSESNMFPRVEKEAKYLFLSGVELYKVRNIPEAIRLFRKAVFMLHGCRLANEEEEKLRDKLLKKLYTNLSICYININQPLKCCTACNELNRIDNLWNNTKALFQNAKALRMIGEFQAAEKKLRGAIKNSPDREELKEELKLLHETKVKYEEKKMFMKKMLDKSFGLVNDCFKKEVDEVIESFKQSNNMTILPLPPGLNPSELDYIKQACARQNLYCYKINQNLAVDKNESMPRVVNYDVLDDFSQFEEGQC